MGNEHPTVSPLVRPILLAIVAFAVFGVALISGVIDVPFPGIGLRFGVTVTEVMSRVPDSMVELFGLMFGVYAVGKSIERGTDAYASAKYTGPAPDPQEQ